MNQDFYINVDNTLYLLQEFDYILDENNDGIDVFASNIDLIIRGTVGSGDNQEGIDIGHAASNNTVVIASTGIVSGDDEGIEVDGDFNNITNYGKIIAGKHDGVDFKTSNSSTLNNFGEIVGGSSGLEARGDIQVFNHGQMVGTAGAGVIMIGDNNHLDNTGQIHSHYAAAVRCISDVSETNTFINSGTVSGTNVDGVAVIGGDGVDNITDQGMIYGSVELGGGNDLFYGFGGTIIGSVFGGAGDDRYFVDDPTITLVEESGEGIDTVVANTGWALGANFENLNLVGDGDHTGVGNSLANIISGNIGHNSINGGGGDDLLHGGEGNDTLNGASGDDWVGGDAAMTWSPGAAEMTPSRAAPAMTSSAAALAMTSSAGVPATTDCSAAGAMIACSAAAVRT